MTGTRAPRISLTIARVEDKRPPGGPSWMISAGEPVSRAREMLSRMKSSTAGLMPPSIEIRCTRGSGPLFTAATSGSAPAARKKSATSLTRLELLDDFFDVFPDKFFVPRIAQQVGRMERRHQPDALIIVPLSAQPRNRLLRLEQRLDGEFAQRDDDLRLHQLDLLFEKRLARLDFVGLRVAVLRRAALDHVGDVDVLPPEPHALGDDIGEGLAGAPPARPPPPIFVPSPPPPAEHP